MKGYTGISYPFRIGSRGVVLSTVSPENPQHIKEEIVQILSTRFFERINEPQLGNNIDLSMFEPNDTTLKNLVIYEIVQALSYSSKIRVSENNVSLNQEDGKVFADIVFTIVDYGTQDNVRVTIGGEK